MSWLFRRRSCPNSSSTVSQLCLETGPPFPHAYVQFYRFYFTHFCISSGPRPVLMQNAFFFSSPDLPCGHPFSFHCCFLFYISSSSYRRLTPLFSISSTCSAKRTLLSRCPAPRPVSSRSMKSTTPSFHGRCSSAMTCAMCAFLFLCCLSRISLVCRARCLSPIFSLLSLQWTRGSVSPLSFYLTTSMSI